MASTYLQRTPASAGNRRTWTWSGWVKRSKADKIDAIFSAGADSSNYFNLYFTNNSNALAMVGITGGATDTIYFFTNRKFRDTSAWYHIVFQYDSTNATESDRFKLYVNGVRETSFENTGYNKYPTLNYEEQVNSTNIHRVGELAYATGYSFDGSMAHVHFIDGTAYDASAFGETDATTGIWKPKTAPSVTYGTNGFFLKFENSGAFGTDSSGNANNFTVNGTMTQTIDTPSNVFATLNPLNVPTSNAPTYSNGNLKGTSAALGKWIGSSTLGVSSGKWYMEVKVTEQSGSNSYVGVADEGGTAENAKNNENGNGNGILYKTNGQYRQSINGTTTDVSYGNSYAQGDIIGIALNCDDNEIVFYKNGTAQDSGTPISIPTPDGFLFLNIALGSGLDESFEVNFGNGYFGTTAVSSAQNPDDGIGIFEYDVPTGYRALCTKSINAEEYS